jgi:hypothetical protein
MPGRHPARILHSECPIHRGLIAMDGMYIAHNASPVDVWPPRRNLLAMFSKVLCLALVFASVPPAHSGCAATPSIDGAYGSTPLVFRARVIDVTPAAPRPAWSVLDYSRPGTSPYGGIGNNFGTIDRVHFQILEVFKGKPSPDITLLGTGGLFAKGVEYLVFAIEPENPAWVAADSCLRTKPVLDPQAVTDLTWLRTHRTVGPAGN